MHAIASLATHALGAEMSDKTRASTRSRETVLTGYAMRNPDANTDPLKHSQEYNRLRDIQAAWPSDIYTTPSVSMMWESVLVRLPDWRCSA
jgi:hypothetical protein